MKKIISLLLIFLMLVQLVPVAAFAATEAPFSLTATIEETTATVRLKTTEQVSIGNFSFILSIPEGCTITKIKKGANYNSVYGQYLDEDDEIVSGSFEKNEATGVASCTPANKASDTTIPADSEMLIYTLDVSGANSNSLAFSGTFDAAYSISNQVPLSWENATVTSNALSLGGADPEPTADYEIYYTLDSGADTEKDVNDVAAPDGYKEYEVVDGEGNPSTVTATFYLKNNKAETVLQAYDVYLTHSKLLTPNAAKEGSVFKLFTGDADTTDSIKEAHIQFVANKDEQQAFGTTNAVVLGQIVFTISGDAAYGEELPITIQPGSKELGTNSTNFSIGGAVAENAEANGEGDATSYYPNVIKTVDGVTYSGAEVMTTYTVSYDANGGSGAPADQTKYHNQDLTLSTAEPTRDGYNFLGWTTVENPADGADVEYAKGVTYSANANDVLYAVWERNTKTITFNANDGSDTPATETQTVNHGVATVLDANIFNRTGYTFAGWNTEANGSGTAFADKASITITEDTTLYAQWTINKYTVTWYNYDGTQLHKDENVEYGATPVYDGQTPTKPDSVDGQFAYTHDGWSATQGGAKLDPLPAVDGKEEFYALFAQSTKSYNVTFGAGEGSFAADADTEVTVEYGQKPNAQDIPAPTAPDGYEFTGWSDGTKTYSKDLSDFTVTGEVELTAQYAAAEYVITLDPNGGAVSDMTADEDGKYTITYTITSTDKLPAATKTGYAFDGWKLATKTDGWEANTYGANTPVTGMWGDVELVAQWSEDKHTVMQSDSVQNGTATPDKQSAKEGDTITVTVKPDEGYKFGENNKVTYTYTDAEGTTHNIQITVSDDDGDGVFTGTFPMVDYNVEINATFTAIDYTVNANAYPSGFATVTPDKTTANINDEITLTISDVKDGYQLKNYTVTNDSTDDTIPVTNGKFTMPAANVTVTANLEGKSYQIIYDANGGENTMNPGNGTFGTETTLVKNSFAKTGYTFEGWTTTEGGTTVEYTDEAGFNPETYAEGYTLYAVWQVNTYKITVQDSSNGSVATNATDNDAVAYGTTVTLTATPDAGYQLGQYTVKDSNNADVPVTNGQFTMPASNVTVSATFTLVAYDVNLDNSDTTEGTVSANVEKATMGTVVTLSNTPANGYELDKYTVTYKDADGNDQPITVTDGKFTMPASDVTVKASFKPAMYTITYELDGGNMSGDVSPNYDITDTLKLPKPNKANYTFKGWKVTTVGGNWVDATYNAEETMTGMWGNVTLTAQWDIGFTYSVESYTYAKTGYKMLRIATDGNANAYKFGEETMYYTENADYVTIDNKTYKGVFVTLISGDYVDSNNELTDAAMEMITQTNGAAIVIARDGDVNGDEVVNIADANVVYQMVQNGGSYYGNLGNESQSDILSRLEADMHTETKDNDFRGTTQDVDVIVNKINGTTATN